MSLKHHHYLDAILISFDRWVMYGLTFERIMKTGLSQSLHKVNLGSQETVCNERPLQRRQFGGGLCDLRLER